MRHIIIFFSYIYDFFFYGGLSTFYVESFKDLELGPPFGVKWSIEDFFTDCMYVANKENF